MNEQEIQKEFEPVALAHGHDITPLPPSESGEPFGYYYTGTQLFYEGWQACWINRQNEIAKLIHQHENDEAANQMLSEVCAMQRGEIIELRKRLG